MKATVSVQGVREVQAALARIQAGVAQRRGAVMASAADPIAARMRETVAVDTGETRDTIAVEQAGGGAVVAAGGASLLLEYGTSRMPARPFARPAVDGESGRAIQAAGQALAEIIKESV